MAINSVANRPIPVPPNDDSGPVGLSSIDLSPIEKKLADRLKSETGIDLADVTDITPRDSFDSGASQRRAQAKQLLGEIPQNRENFENAVKDNFR
ncbi:MAG: hypothetical protein ACT4TC_16700 [Myxococcaceae bacterium]